MKIVYYVLTFKNGDKKSFILDAEDKDAYDKMYYRIDREDVKKYCCISASSLRQLEKDISSHNCEVIRG